MQELLFDEKAVEQQGLLYTAVYKVTDIHDTARKVLIKIKVDTSYPFQSHASLEVFSYENCQWNFLSMIHWTNIKSHEATKEEKLATHISYEFPLVGFEQDVELLLNHAEKIFD